jgi:iron complex outermembrane recepter protein
MKSKSKLGWMLRAGASLVAIGAATPAMAQEADDGVSDEIVVTATGRTAAIQDVPIAVTAIGHETLQDAGVNNLIDLRQVTPNLRIGAGQSTTSGTSASIRGLGTGSDNPGFEAAVGIFIDGVYRARAGGAVADLADIERVEVLRGPQGTLYGKNTTAGAISVVTAAPDMDFAAWGEGTIGELSERAARFGINAPFGDNFALRFDGTLRNRDGYIDVVNIPGETVNTVDRWSGRLQALWDISPAASLRVIVDSAGTDEQCCAAVTLADTSIVQALNSGFPFSWAMNLTQPGSVLTPSLPVAVAANPEARQTSSTPGHVFSEGANDFGTSAQLDWEIGGVNFTSITAYRDWDSLRDQDIDFSAMDRSYRDGLSIGVSSFTQELRLQGENGRLNWLVGAFFGSEDVEQTDRIQYGTQADDYIDRLLGFFDFSLLGAPDSNGGLPGSGADVFSCTPGAPGASTCATDYAFGGMFSAGAAGNSLVAGTSGALASGIGTLSADFMTNGLPGGSGQQNDRWAIDTTSIALFTHNEFAISDQTTLTVGARWTREEKDMRADIDADQPACDAIRDNPDAIYGALIMQEFVRQNGTVGNATLDTLIRTFPSALTLTCNPAVNDVQDGAYGRSLEDDAFSGTLSLSHHLSDDVMIYGGYSRGYKSGGFNIDRSGMSIFPWTVDDPSLLPAYSQSALAYLQSVDSPYGDTSFGAEDLQFAPETIDAFELGLKSTVFGNSTTVNAAVFFQQLHDFQLNAFNGFNFITENVPEVVSQGVELEVSARPTDELTLTFGALYLDVYYDSTIQFGTNPSDIVNSGDPLTQSPEWTLTGSIAYERPAFNDLTFRAYLNGRYLSDYRLQTLSRNPLTDQEAFAIFDARVGLGSDTGWGVDVFVRNLTDEYYSIGAFAVPEQSLYLGATGQVEGVFAAYPNEPRTVGITLRGRF